MVGDELGTEHGTVGTAACLPLLAPRSHTQATDQRHGQFGVRHTVHSRLSLCLVVLSLLAAGALLFVSQTVAAPTTTDAAAASDSDSDNNSASAGKSAAAAGTAVNWGSPQCKSRQLYDLCTADNAGAYCDGTGFHNNFMASCKGVCWCE
ncbi:uncharacterized protein B0T15DRAFT_510636 [Chaetomium strumarium]|uniref:Uncharacterized protein n=1 Tax=Chaetomium strumarium TaxID=1170767 RepID=A0AAJ0M398_9PEZI|nr:hypothetical protein B0T15DRAFT_510636 [Chaetomium strumarium]